MINYKKTNHLHKLINISLLKLIINEKDELNLKIIGITGKSGSGKSTLSSYLAKELKRNCY